MGIDHNRALNQANKQQLWKVWQELEAAPVAKLPELAAIAMSPDMQWHGFAPHDPLEGPARFLREFWVPFRNAFSNPKRESHMFFGGNSCGRADGQGSEGMWVGGTGYFHGVFQQDWLGIPANGEAVTIRWGELCQMQDGVITTTYILLDLIDLLQQAGFDVLPPARGQDGLYPPPPQ